MWAEQAEELRSDAGELGHHIAAIHAAAWRARVDPDATGGLAGAATALYAPARALFDRGQPMPSDRTLIGEVEDCQIATWDLRRTVIALQAGARNALDVAADKLRRAVAAARNAKTNGDLETARELAGQAREVIADCEMALEITASVLARLSYAMKCLERVPEDLSETYEAAYRLLRENIKLPADGDFLTGTPATPGQPSHAIAR